MKLTLFTISNEQIKEQLSKLQTKVDSLETVKDVQDKIISAKDSQISFLNDQIANIWTPITIVAGFIALVFGYVAWLNRQADKKVKQGEEQLALAQEKIEQAEALIQQSQSTNTIAQEKLEQLEEKQKDINKQAEQLKHIQKADTTLNTIKHQIDLLKRVQELIKKSIDIGGITLNPEEETKFNSYLSLITELESKWVSESYGFNLSIVNGVNVANNKKIEDLASASNDLLTEFLDFEQDLPRNF